MRWRRIVPRVFFIVVVAITASLSIADAPQIINFQGTLTSSTGQPLQSGTYSLEVSIYDAPSLGLLLWGPFSISDVALVDGQFNVLLGPSDLEGREIRVAFQKPDAYIGIRVNGGVEINPRQKVLSAPYAMNASGPVGVVQAFCGTSETVPSGWMICDGRQLSRTEYATLFAVIGTSFGSGDGATTFNVPDFRGRFLRGADGGAGRDPDRESRQAMNNGGATGDAVGTVQNYSVERHTHGFPGREFGGGDPIRTITYGNQGASTTITMSEYGGSETRPMNAAVHWIVKY